MNERIRQLADHVRDHAPKLIQEAETSILEAIEVARENQEDEEKELILSIPISVRWNLDSNKIEVSVAVAVKHKYTHQGRLADPNQPELLDGEGKPLPEKFSKALGQIDSALKSHGAKMDVKLKFGSKEFDADAMLKARAAK